MLIERKIYKVELRMREGIETNYVFEDALNEIIKEFPYGFVSAKYIGTFREIQHDKL